MRGWAKTRAGLLVAALLVLAVVFGVRDARGPAEWADLLKPHGVNAARDIHWLLPPIAGQWTPGLVVAYPSVRNQGGEMEVSKHTDLFVFEGMVVEGDRPFAVRKVGNASQTSAADDELLGVESGGEQLLVAVGRKLEGVFTGVDVLDLHGDATIAYDETGAKRSLLDRARIHIIHRQDTGRWEGVGRRLYTLPKPMAELQAWFDSGSLFVEGRLRDGAKRRRAQVRLDDGSIYKSQRGLTLELVEQTEPWVLPGWTAFTVNRVRLLPWVGPRKIAALERVVFDAVELARENYYDVAEADFSEMQQELAAVPEAEPPSFDAVEGAIAVGGSQEPWPPPPIEPLELEGLKPIPNEGRWSRWVPEWRDAKEAAGKPWPYYRTALRVNAKRKYDYITVIAMDLRQLDLGMVAGVANPTSTTGYRGTGRLPEEDITLFEDDFVVFNGGFKSEHGAYGMMVDGKLISEPRPGAGTLAVANDGRVLAGVWPGIKPEHEFGENKQWLFMHANNAVPVPSSLRSFRQNLPPLVADGKINPAGVRRWGGVVEQLTDASTPRSSVCLRGDATLMYIWASASSADDLGRAHLMAGCDFGIHLDMNPVHTGMMMHNVPLRDGKLPPQDAKTGYAGAKYEPAAQRMRTDWYRYLKRSGKDFFYLRPRPNLTDRLTRPDGYAPWKTKGLPVAHKGANPLAALGGVRDMTFLALEGGAFQASVVQEAPFEPGSGAKGEVHVGLQLQGAPDQGPWKTDPKAASSLAGLHVTEDGRLRVVHGTRGAIKTPKAFIPGDPVLIDGKLQDNIRDPFKGPPVIAAMNGSGDVILAVCRNCMVAELGTALRVLGMKTAVLLGAGDLFAVAANGDGAWVAARPVDAPDVDMTRLKLVPQAPPPRAGLVDFRKLADASKPAPAGAAPADAKAPPPAAAP